MDHVLAIKTFKCIGEIFPAAWIKASVDYIATCCLIVLPAAALASRTATSNPLVSLAATVFAVTNAIDLVTYGTLASAREVLERFKKPEPAFSTVPLLEKFKVSEPPPEKSSKKSASSEEKFHWEKKVVGVRLKQPENVSQKPTLSEDPLEKKEVKEHLTQPEKLPKPSLPARILANRKMVCLSQCLLSALAVRSLLAHPEATAAYPMALLAAMTVTVHYVAEFFGEGCMSLFNSLLLKPAGGLGIQDPYRRSLDLRKYLKASIDLKMASGYLLLSSCVTLVLPLAAARWMSANALGYRAASIVLTARIANLIFERAEHLIRGIDLYEHDKHTAYIKYQRKVIRSAAILGFGALMAYIRPTAIPAERIVLASVLSMHV